MTNERVDIAIGEFVLSFLPDGKAWLSRDGGESMEMGSETLAALRNLLEAFWDEHF